MVKVRVMEYDMKDFLISCVARYTALAGKSAANLRWVETPFIDESKVAVEKEDLGGCTSTDSLEGSHEGALCGQGVPLRPPEGYLRPR